MRNVRLIIGEVAPTIPLTSLTSVEEQLDQELSPLRLNAVVFGSFGAMALVIAALGVYGVTAQLVTKRKGEFGVRMALGAQPNDVVLGLILTTLRTVTIGVIVGVIGSLLVARTIRAFLYGLSPTDPTTYAAVTLLFAAVALVATYFPARRATRANPIDALRTT